MASIAQEIPVTSSNDDRFFVRGAILIAIIIVAGFSTQYLMGRSTFAAPPLVHALGGLGFATTLTLIAAGQAVAAVLLAIADRLR